MTRFFEAQLITGELNNSFLVAPAISYFGRLEQGVFASLGCFGVGLPRGTISGKLLAEYALGSESDLIADVQAVSGPKRLPPEPFLGLGVNALLAWDRWSNNAEW